MIRCLSDEALMRVLAELGTGGERAHLATCLACTARSRRLTDELDVIRQVLVATPEPRSRAVPGRRGWVPAVAALSAVAVGALLWIELTVWKALEPAPTPPQQVAAMLADVSSALFSVDGEPAWVLVESPVPGLQQDDNADTACDGPAWLDAAGCGDALAALESPVEAMDSSTFDGDDPEQDDAEQGG